MPYKDPDKRRAKQKDYYKTYVAKNKPLKSIGECTALGCKNKTSGTNKRCDSHLEFMRNYKKEYRKKPRPEGICSNYPDCSNEARYNLKLCERCNRTICEKQKLPKARAYRRSRDQIIQEEVLVKYGNKCLCCEESNIQFLSLDHIDGYNGEGPRGGTQLYRWVRNNNYPQNFRVLCISCNFALGHHGYCPHSNLTQKCSAGRPETKGVYTKKQKKENRERWILRKIEVFNAYGGCKCKCCGESNLECLSIDHINNDGAAHRKELTGNARDGRNLYIWLQKNNYPPGFQVLCMNCNFAKGHFGQCPHELARSNISTSFAFNIEG